METKTVFLPTLFKISSFVFYRSKNIIQVQNDWMFNVKCIYKVKVDHSAVHKITIIKSQLNSKHCQRHLKI